jgi:RHS repeat-associated protein
MNVTDPEHNVVTYAYDALGRIKTLIDQNGRAYTSTYDSSSHLIALDGPLGYHLGFEFDPNNNLTKQIDPNGGVTEYVYDGSERLTDVFNQLRHQTTFGYDALGHLTATIDAEGRLTTYEYNAVYDQVAVHAPEDTHAFREYDAVGNLLAETDPQGRTTAFTYNALNWLVERVQNAVAGAPADAATKVRTLYEYDNVGNLIRLVDGNGNPTAFVYDALDRLTSSTNAEQETTLFAYDGEGNLIRRTNPRSFSTTWRYDGNNRMVELRDAADNPTTYVYDPAGNLTDEIDAYGVVTHHQFNELNRLSATLRNYRPGQPANHETNVATRFAYDLAGNLVKSWDARGNLTAHGYDAAHRRITTTDAQSGVTTLRYDRVNNLLDVEDAEKNHLALAYDDLNRLTMAADAEGHVKSYGYDKVGNLLVFTNARGYSTTTAYDALNRPISIIDAKSGHVSMAYDAMGNLLSLTDQLDHTDSWTYDRVYRPLSYADAEDIRTGYAYDDNGNLIELVDGNRNPTRSTYTALDQLESVTNAELETTSYRYNKVGKLTHAIAADGVVTRYGFDPLYRLTGVTLNDRPGIAPTVDINVTYRYAYDATGNLVGITDPRSNTTAFAFDSLNRAVRETNPLGNVWASTYDKVGNLKTYLDANNHLTRYTRDADYNVTRIDYYDQTFVAFAYDENHNRVAMTDSLGAARWAYDELDREVSASDSLGRSFAQTYDAVGNRLGATYPDGRTVAYTYLRNDWMRSVTDPRGHVTTYERDGVGSITRSLNPNSTVAEMTYDKANRLLTLSNRQIGFGDHLISAYAYTLDDVGQRVKAVQQYGWRNPGTVVETYRYDPLRRVVAVENDDGNYRATYRYDAAGNRVGWSASDDLGTQAPRDSFVATYEYNAANQLLSAAIDSVHRPSDRTYAFRYDGNGNRVNSEWNGPQGPPTQGTDYAYDPENRVVQALNYQSGGKNRVNRDVTRMAYDGLGRRLVKEYDPKLGSGGAKRTEYAFDGLDPVAEYDMWNQQRRNFYRGADQRLVSLQLFRASDGEGLMSWYHYDGLGSVSGLTRHQGQSTHNYRYDVYGAVYPERGNFVDPHNHYTYTGQEWDDETAMLHFYARDYDPAMAVWLQQDPYRGRLPEPQTTQRYAYVQGNPVNYVDAYGYKAFYVRGMNSGGIKEKNSSGVYTLYQRSLKEKIVCEQPSDRYYDEPLVNPLTDLVLRRDSDDIIVKDIEAFHKLYPNEPIILVGHSWGADTAVEVAEKLNKLGISIDLLVTIDAIGKSSAVDLSGDTIPSNVKENLNFYQRNEGEILQGGANTAASSKTHVINYNMTYTDGYSSTRSVTHTNIDDNRFIQETVSSRINAIEGSR